LLNDF